MVTQPAAPNLSEALGDEAEIAAQIAPLWADADILPAYPAVTETVAKLLFEAGYDVSKQTLESWVRSGMIPDVKMRSGQFVLSPKNILTARIHAETWKRWRPLHPKHLHKMSGVEVAEMMASAEGATAFTDLGVFDLPAFLTMVERCNDPQLRHVLVTALRTKIRQLAPEILNS